MTLPRPTRLDHVITVDQFTRQTVEALCESAGELGVSPSSEALRGKIMAALFYEASTRTRLSFESAMLRGGGAVISEIGRDFSSCSKGETLEDTIRMACAYADVIVLRHPEAEAAARAAAVATVPVVNAGDGANQHPTQALVDAYTIRREVGRLDNVHVAFSGDLRYGRTARSTALLLSLFPGVRLSFVAPPVVQIDADILRRLRDRRVPVAVVERFAELGDDVDVLYQTRIQRERFDNPEEFDRARGDTRINMAVMDALPGGIVIMHPLPRIDEIAADVDHHPRAAYFRQAANGVAVRLALLQAILG